MTFYKESSLKYFNENDSLIHGVELGMEELTVEFTTSMFDVRRKRLELEGQVIASQSGNPIAAASIIIGHSHAGGFEPRTRTVADSTGHFALTLDLEKSDTMYIANYGWLAVEYSIGKIINLKLP